MPRHKSALKKPHNKYYLWGSILCFCAISLIVIIVGVFLLLRKPAPSSPQKIPSPPELLTQTLMPILSSTSTSLPVPASMPSSTQIPISLSDIKLEPVLVLPGDLPRDYIGSPVRDITPSMFDLMPVADKITFRQFEKSEKVAGFVVVFLYHNQSDIDKGYQYLLKGLDNTTITLFLRKYRHI
jgi:hypothetical protein